MVCGCLFSTVLLRVQWLKGKGKIESHKPSYHVQKRATKLVKVLELKSYKEWWPLGYFVLKEAQGRNQFGATSDQFEKSEYRGLSIE